MDEAGAIDRYVVLEYLAEGGMGAIYLGKKLGAGGFEKTVVLKQLLPEFTRQPEFIDLFLREARLSATLDHANIIHTIDLVTAGEEHFIVMEYLDGADLRTLLKRAKRRHGRFSAPAGIYIARELLSALAYAHNKRGVDGQHLRLIHRDISPSNILVSGNGEVKLTDFGIAKASTHNSVFYRVKGKVGYMSPEQASSAPIDARSDLYSLAVCLFEVVTGERLFVHQGLTTSAEEMYAQPVPLLSSKVRGLPAEFDKVMLRALSPDPGYRYQSAGEFQEALLRCAHRNGLMMSAPELAEHLREVCGPGDRWRDVEDASGPQSLGRSAGTEIYDGLDESSADSDLAFALGPGKAILPQGPVRKQRQKTSITHLGELQGIELTSMFAVNEDSDHEGAEPLVDLDDFGGGMPGGPEFGPAPMMMDAVGSAPIFDEDADTGFVVRPPTGEILNPDYISEYSSDSLPVSGSVIVEDQQPTKKQRPWLFLLFILLVGIGTATAIGLTGPNLAPTDPEGNSVNTEENAPDRPASGN